MNRMLYSIVWMCLTVCLTAPVYADIEWGGGNVQFYSLDQTYLTNYNGLASLVAVRQGELIDMNHPSLESSDMWVTPGSVITDGTNVNVVIAVSWAFDKGMLWMSGSPYVTTETMVSYGINPGDRFYIIIWDRNTFQWNHPVEGSTYTTLQLFIDGDINAPAIAYGDSDFGDTIRPDETIDQDVCDQFFMKPKGDIDGDGHLDVKDIIVVLQIFANIDVQIENDMMYFDVNDNGRVDYGELLYLLGWIAK